MVRALLIDDEVHALENLQILLSENCPQVKVIGSATAAIEGMKYIKNKKPDVVFLDISMPYATGFDMLDALEEKNFEVVFVTAHEEFAIKAIKIEAFDYLLKPIQISELKKCVENLKSNLRTDREILSVHTIDSIEFVKISDISYCKSEHSYCHIFLQDGSHYFFTKQLKALEMELPKDLFLRCHNSYIVNRTYVARYNKLDGGVLEMKNAEQIPISRIKKDLVLAWLKA